MVNGISLLLISLVLTGLAVAESPDDNLTGREEKNLTFRLDQRVSGNGFFATYKHALMPDELGTPGALLNGVEFSSRAHSSGRLDLDLQIYAENSYLNESYISVEYDEDGEPYEDLEESNSAVKIKEDSKMTYSPVTMPAASPYYSLHPQVLRSLLKDEIYLKNRDGLNSINHKVEEAHGIEKKIEARADPDVNSLKVEEDLIDGRAHFGVIQLVGIPVDEEDEDSEEEIVLGLAMKDWKKPKIELEEDYVGTFHIKKNMSLESSSEEEEKEDGWRPCCFDGYLDMNTPDRRSWQVQEVFDCTCFRMPNRTQFAR